jgi:hypothetical protein
MAEHGILDVIDVIDVIDESQAAFAAAIRHATA